MSVCSKHGIFSTLCKQCDQDTIDKFGMMESIHKEPHYKFIEKYGEIFAKPLNIKGLTSVDQNASADGDKCYQYKEGWYEQGIPFPIGVMIYLVSKEYPFLYDVRETDNGWVAPEDWVANIYNKVYKIESGYDEKYKVFCDAIKNVVEQYQKDKKYQ